MKNNSFKKGLLLMISAVLLTAACDRKTTEATTESLPADTIKKDGTETAAPASETELTGKANMVAKEWKALEFETPTAKLSGEFVDIRFNFKKDGSFDYSEDGKKEKGTWKLNDNETMLMLEYDDKMQAELEIKELSEEKMTIAGKEHGMYRTYVLAPKK